MKTITCSILMLFILSIFIPVCAASSPEGNSLAAIALYIDTSGSYFPGMDLLNRALNEIIRYKINALFPGSEVQSGNEVLRELRRCNVSTAKTQREALSDYGNTRHGCTGKHS